MTVRGIAGSARRAIAAAQDPTFRAAAHEAQRIAIEQAEIAGMLLDEARHLLEQDDARAKESACRLFEAATKANELRARVSGVQMSPLSVSIQQHIGTGSAPRSLGEEISQARAELAEMERQQRVLAERGGA